MVSIFGYGPDDVGSIALRPHMFTFLAAAF
jgi:hypothetical protein